LLIRTKVVNFLSRVKSGLAAAAVLERVAARGAGLLANEVTVAAREFAVRRRRRVSKFSKRWNYFRLSWERLVCDWVWVV